MVKVNVDTYVQSGRLVGFGTVVRDELGRMSITGARRIPYTIPAIAESLAAGYGMALTRRFRLLQYPC